MRTKSKKKRYVITTTISEEDRNYCIERGLEYKRVLEIGIIHLKTPIVDNTGQKTDINLEKFEKIVNFSHDLNEKLIRAESKYLELYEKYNELKDKRGVENGSNR